MTARSVHEEPEVTVVHWAIMRDRFGLRLLGFRADTLRGRISSPIVSADRAEMALVTESGRVYRLRGPEDHKAAAVIMDAHALRWGLAGRGEVELVNFEDAVLALTPKPSEGLH